MEDEDDNDTLLLVQLKTLLQLLNYFQFKLNHWP